MQGGLDWELIAMIAAGASAALIGWDFFASRGGARSDTRKGLLEIAWPGLGAALVFQFDAVSHTPFEPV